MSQQSRLWSRIRRFITHRRLWQAGGLLLSANIIVVALEVLRVPIVTRLLTKEEVGMIAIVASVLPLLQLLSLTGLDGSTYHYIAKGHTGALRAGIGVRLRWSMLSVLGFLIGGIYWLWKDNTLLAGLFTITAAMYPVARGLTAAASALTAREDFGRLFWYRIGEAASRYSGLVVVIALPAMSTQVLWYSLGNQLMLGLLQLGVVLWLLSHFRAFEAAPMPTKDRAEMIRYGKHLTAMNAIAAAQTRVDAPLIAWLLSRSVMADFWVAQLVQAQFKRLWTIYYTLRYPPLVRLPVDRLRRRIVFEAGILLVGYTLVGVGAVAALRIALPIVLPAEYASSLPLIAWLIAAFVASIPGFFAEMYFRMRQNERRQYLLRGVSAVSGVALPCVAIALWQLQGVVVARFVISLIFSAVGIALFMRDNNTEIEEPASQQ